MHTLDLAALFPNAVIEKITGYDGSDKAIIERAVDIEVLRQDISAQVALGDVSEPDIRRVKIRETIRSHFEKECELYGKSIKCLFPFFIDEVAKCRFQQLWNLIKCKYAYTVEFDSDELLRKAAAHIDQNMFVTQLQYTVTTGCQEEDMSAEHIESGTAFVKSKTKTANIKRTESSHVTYDIIGRRAEGAKLTRRSASKILAGITPRVFDMFRSNPEEFIVKAVKLINEKKADMIVKHITYRPTGDTYGSEVFTADKNSKFSNLCKAKKNVQDYVVIDG